MKIIRTRDYDDMSRKAANIISALMTMKPECVLGLATGSTPIGTYRNLVNRYLNGDLDFSGVTTVNLDEYKGITRENDQSYYYFMNHNLFQHVNIDLNRTFLPDGTEPDALKACDDYNKVIEAAGGVDLQILGLGHNGHIGFNEPCGEFPDTTHLVRLTPETIDANKRFFASAEDVPRQALSMGIGTIMRARGIVLIITGKEKAQITKQALTGPVTPSVPASILQYHKNVTVLLDSEAASLL